MKDTVVIFSSYNKSPEFEEKMENVKKLKLEGINANLFYLLKLTSDDKLPKINVDSLIISNIQNAINLFKPNILAFHNGLTISLRKQEFIKAINSTRRCNFGMIYLIEYLNCPERSSVFRNDPDFLKWCKSNFEKEHTLCNVIWKSKI
jgi:hypothetical protein